MADKFIKTGRMNRAIFDGSWEEFCENLIKFDIPSQQKAHKAGLAPNAYEITFDHNQRTYSLSMDMIHGETLLNYINERVSIITIEELDKIVQKVGQLYKQLFSCIKSHHPDWAARNIMIQDNDPDKYWVIDFEAFYVDNETQSLDEEDYVVAMRYFCCDLSGSFSGELQRYLLKMKNF